VAGEFELIQRFFTRRVTHTVLSVGDDGALLGPRAGMQLAVSTDMLVSGVHFLPDADPAALGWKALAVNLSDLAAMAAEPRWSLLAIALPEAKESWIEPFAEGFFACADAFGVDLVGGDTTRGPLAIAPTVIGEVPVGSAITRSGAQPGDDVWVSGTPGLAALALAALRGETDLSETARARCLAALEQPQPRVALGLALRGLAHAMIDVSDGLIADLGHIAERSGVSIELADELLPIEILEAATGAPGLARRCLLAGGDDYELAFTSAVDRRECIAGVGARLGVALARIGQVRSGPPAELRVVDRHGQSLPLAGRGYQHFVEE
jgi:thiamine-monophosphate kinase